MRAVLIIGIWLCCLWVSCVSDLNSHTPVVLAGLEIPMLKVLKNDVELRPEEGLVFYKNRPFTGTTFLYYRNGKIAEEIEYLNGKQHGSYKKWFDTGLLSFEANYVNGYLDGSNTSWWANGNIRSRSQYIEGKMHGEQIQWYQSGAKFKERNMVMDREEGMQRSWRENGKLYNNYEARDGRIFGLKRANLCYSLQDEEIQINE